MQLRRPAVLALVLLSSLAFAACSGKADPTAPSLDFPGAAGSTGTSDGNSAGSTQFEGPVSDVDVPGALLRLANGQTVRVDGSTQWSRRGDVIDLASLAAAVSQGRPGRVEGSGVSQSDGSLLAATLKAEIDETGAGGDDLGNDDGPGDDDPSGDDNGDDDGSADNGNDDSGDDSGDDQPGPVNEFEGTVSSVNVSGSSVQLTNGTTVVVDSGTRWDALGDVMSLSALASRIAAGGAGRVEGDGQFDGAVVRAVVIKAEIDEPDDIDDDSDDDDDGSTGSGSGDDDDDDDDSGSGSDDEEDGDDEDDEDDGSDDDES